MGKFFSILLTLFATISAFLNLCITILFFMMANWGGSASADEITLVFLSGFFLFVSLCVALIGVFIKKDIAYQITGAFLLILLLFTQIFLMFSGTLEQWL